MRNSRVKKWDLRSQQAVAGLAVGLGAAVLLTRSLLARARLRSLEGQVVCITGASRGLGLALAEAFGRLGSRVVLCARNAAELDRARMLLLQRGVVGGDILTVVADVCDPAAVQAMVERANAAFGRVDVLVNNAGIITVGPVQNHSAANFHESMQTNFFGAVHCTLAVLPQMVERGGGSIVNIASVGGKVAVPHLLPYTASKFAVVGFSQGLSAELRSYGIHVLTVCPGLMRTGSYLQALFTGDAPGEYRWFSFLANLPGMSASARSAADSIVRALTAGRTQLAITLQAAIAGRLGPALPEVVSRVSSLAQQALPKPEGNDLFKGADVRSKEMWPATQIGQNAAHKYNQLR